MSFAIGFWVPVDSYNHTDQITTEDLIAKTQEDGGAPGVWAAELLDCFNQAFTSISTNLYDFAEHLDEDGNVKKGEDPVSLFQTENGGYWQKLTDNRWAYTFFVFQNEDISWHIWEDAVAGYTGSYTITNMLDIEGNDIQAGVQPVITNTSTNAPKCQSLTLTKKVVDTNGAAYTSDKSFTFTVTLAGDHISGSQMFGDAAFQNGIAKVQLGAGESITLSDIPVGTTYTVTEDPIEGYTSAIDNPTGTVVNGKNVTVTCTNTKSNEQKDYVSFSVKKEVVSNADESDGNYTFHAVFAGLEISTTYTLSDGTTFTSDEDGNGNVDFSLKKDETLTVQNIPVNARYIITEDGGDYTSSYKITDSNGVGKIVSATGSSNQTNTALSTLNETADKGENVLVTFTNKFVRTQNIVLTKVSLKTDGTTDTDDTSQYLVDINLSGLTGGQKIKTSSGLLIADDDGKIESSLYISPNSKLTIFDVPVGTTYMFSEQANNKIASYAISDTVNVVSTSGKNTDPDKALSTAEETVDFGENATVTFTNTSPKSAKLQVIKYDNSTNKKKLGGAEFALYKQDGTAVNFTKDGTNVIKINDNGSSDVLDSSLFVAGEYYLEEIKAPDGYMISEPKSFEITASDAGKTFQIEVYDDKLIVLPVTGGEGKDRYISMACILMAATASLLIYRKRKIGE